MSVVGGVFIAWAALGLVVRRAFSVALGAAAAFPTTAAVTVGAVSIPPFYVLGLVAAILCISVDNRGKGRAPASQANLVLLLFVAVSVVGAVLGPVLFAGTPILLPRGGIDNQVSAPTPLQFTQSSWAQVAYLLIGAAVVWYLSRANATVVVLRAAFGTGTLVCTAALVAKKIGAPWPNDLFQNAVGAGYNEYETRFFGTFAEPSYLAVFAIAAAAFYLFEAFDRRRIANLLMLALAVLLLVESDSGTAALAAVVVCVLQLFRWLAGFTFGRSRLDPVVALSVLWILAFIAIATPIFHDLSAMIAEKLGTQSADNRFAADLFSLHLVGETWGLGVGLGSNRPSSFLTMLLSCVGILGTGLFALFVFLAVRGQLGRPESRAAAWSLLALLIAKVAAEPALSTPLLWLTTGVLIALAREPQGGQRPTDGRHDLSGVKRTRGKESACAF